MRARVGDVIHVSGHRAGEPEHVAEVLEVRGDDGGAPYLVRWRHDDHVGLYFPGTDAAVEHPVSGEAS